MAHGEMHASLRRKKNNNLKTIPARPAGLDLVPSNIRDLCKCTQSAAQTWKHERHTSSEAFVLGLGQTSGKFQWQYLEA